MGRATWRQYWKREAPEVLGGLPPFLLHAVEGGGDDQDHQGELEVEVGEAQAPEAVEVEARVVEADPEDRLQEDRHQPDPSQGGDEREGQRHAGEVGGHPGERDQEAPHAPGQPAEGDRVGEEEAEERAAQRA